MKLNLIYKILILLAIIVNLGCTEQIALSTESFEDVLVVEATITNELKTQQISLSRTFPLEGGRVVEDNANVKIVDTNNNEYIFINIGGGIYNSMIEFRAQQGVSYKLIIITSEGKVYNSNDESLPPQSEISRLYAELVTTSEGKTGVQVLVDSDTNTGATYFRYEYEETYQRVAKSFFALDLVPEDVEINSDPITYNLVEVDRPESERVCYSYNESSEIIITNTNGLDEQGISKFPVVFIPEDDDRIRDRYSVLVKQYIQSANANNYYRILKDLSDDVSLLLDKQPGFIQGNMFSVQNTEEKVIGFFEISTVSEKRVFFNYEDFGLMIPPYFARCNLTTLSYNKTSPNERLKLYELLVEEGYKYIGIEDENIYNLVPPQCGNCTSFASNIRPDFWED